MRRSALVALLLLAAATARGEDQARSAASVALSLPPGEDRAAAEALLAVARGEPVTTRGLRRTATRLYQSGRCRNVVIHEYPAEAPPGAEGRWVDLVVECLPLRRLAAFTVELDGPSPLDEKALAAASGLTRGEPVEDLDVDAARERLRVALVRRGHRAATVEATSQGEGSVTVRLLVRPGPPSRVAAVRAPGAGADEAALLARLATRPGAVLDEERLEADLGTLRTELHKAGWRRARLGVPLLAVTAEGVVVELPVDAGPRLRVTVRGGGTFGEAELMAQVGLDDEQTFDATAIDAAQDRLRAYCRARGYAAARIEVEERRAGDVLAVVFHVDEGRTYRLRHLRVEGADQKGEEAIRDRLRALLEEEGTAEPGGDPEGQAKALLLSVPGHAPRRAPPPPLPPGEIYDEAAVDRAGERIVEDYRNDGYLEAVSLGSSAELDAQAGAVDVTLRLREGSQTRIDSIAYDGHDQLPLTDLVKETQLAPGQPLAYERLEATRVAILRRYLERGFLYARVEAREDLDQKAHLAAVRFLIEEGPRVKVGRIVVTGALRTREEVIRKQLEVAEGRPYDAEAMARSQAALLRLGVFRSVGLRLQDPEVPEATKDLAVELAERPWQFVAAGPGFSIANGPRVAIEYGQPNLAGRALELGARLKVNYPISTPGRELPPASPKNRLEGRADASLRAPRLVLLPVAGRLDLIGEKLHKRAYDLQRVAGVVGVDLPLTSRIGLSLQYELEFDNINKVSTSSVLTQADVERLRFDQGTTTLNSIRPTITFDFRDNSAHPRQGWYATGSAELAHSLGQPGETYLGFIPGGDIHTNLVKVQGTLSGYLPAGGGSVLALSARAGRIIQLDAESRTIIPKRFFMGGASSMRGFAEEELIPQEMRAVLGEEARHCASSATGDGCTGRGRDLADGKTVASEGGEAFLLLKAELRLALKGNLEAGLFVDLGNLWLDPMAFRVLDMRPCAGVGLRFVTPIGPAALDLGFNLRPDARINERSFAPHFTVGLF